jgi:hypothetical protein
MQETPQQSPDGSRQPVPVKLMLPRWLTRGAIIYVIVCILMLIPFGAIAVYRLIQSTKGYPPEEQRRDEERGRAQVEEARQKVQELLHPSPSPSPVKRIPQSKPDSVKAR